MTRHNTDLNGFFYYSSSTNSKILIHTGTHGDEYEVIDLVHRALKKYQGQMESFLYVPFVSPSAVRNRSRENALGKDMNRVFYDNSDDPEVISNIEVIKNEKFDLFVSFHEDPELEEYYIYDVGYSKTASQIVKRHNQFLFRNKVKLFDGVDDPNDPFLGYEFVDGYRKFVHPENYKDDGSVSAWVLNRNICREYLCPEIPGKLDLKTKEMIVNSFFEMIILNKR